MFLVAAAALDAPDVDPIEDTTLRLARPAADAESRTALDWLRSSGQPDAVIRLFWQPVIESALGESLDLVSLAATRKVAVDAFLAHRDAADLIVPTEPLGTLFGTRLVGWLEDRGVTVRTGMAATGFDRAYSCPGCTTAHRQRS